MTNAREYYEERAGIREFYGCFTRVKAERLAAQDLRESNQFTEAQKREVLK